MSPSTAKEWRTTGPRVFAASLLLCAAAAALAQFIPLPALPIGPPRPVEFCATFAFTHSPATNVTGYRIYWGTNVGEYWHWRDIPYTNLVRITNASYPIYAAVCARTPAGKLGPISAPSGLLGTEQQAVIVAQTNGTPADVGWADAFPVTTQTNPPDTLFYRLRIERQTRLNTFP